jgi:hypothetical protein
MHSYLREAGFTWLWWIQGIISITLTAVGMDKTTTKETFQSGFSSHSFTQIVLSGL